MKDPAGFKKIAKMAVPRLAGLLLGVAAMVSLVPQTAFAQQPTSLQLGVNPRATYSSTDLDSVDPVTGQLNLHIPLLSDHSQRGNLNFSYSIDWTGFGPWVEDCDTNPCMWSPSILTDNGNANVFGPSLIMDNALGGVENIGYYDDGTPCLLGLEAGVGSHPFQGSTWGLPTSCPTGDFTMESADATGLQLKYTSATGEAVMTNQSGVQFHYPADSAEDFIEDPNGNVVTSTSPWYVNYDMAADMFTGDAAVTSGVTLWTLMDTLNRPWQLNYVDNTGTDPNFGACPSGTTNAYFWTTPGVSGGSRIFTFCYSGVTFSTAFGSDDGTQEFTESAPLLTQAILPDGTSYQFQYNGYGDLTELDLPTGGKITYTYTTIDDPCGYVVGNLRTLTSRTVYDSSTSSHTWTYSLSNSLSGETMTVTNPLGGKTVYTNAGHCEPVSSVAYSDHDETLLKTDTTTFQNVENPFSWDYETHLPSQITTTLGTSGPSSHQSITYDAYAPAQNGYSYKFGTYTFYTPYGLVQDQAQYDWDGTLLSSASTVYNSFSNSNYVAANILNAPYESVTYSNNGGSYWFDTVYTYDESGYMAASGISSAQQHFSPPNPLALGNVTTVLQHDSTPGGSDNPLTSHRYVYDTGMLQKSVDPAGNGTTYAYSSTYDGAYPTTVTNALGQSVNFAYDANTGLMTSSTDANGFQTTYSGYDNMLRLREIDYPDGGQDTWTPTYSSNTYTGSVYTKKINDSATYTMTTVDDWLGRTTRTQVADPEGTDYTDTTYDALGHVASVSNPYRSTSDPTYGITSYAYDVLGRLRLECNPDNGSDASCAPGASYKRWQYTGNVTDLYDENGVHTQQTANAAGQITKVLETDDTGSLDVETDYTYNGPALVSITQQGKSGDTARTRSFTYDTLERLVTATNPESGTTTYSYNTSGSGLCSGSAANPCSRTDARGIVTTYTYDALSRLTAKSYANDPANTPSLTLTYDTATAYPWFNAMVGRLSGMTTWNGTTPMANWVSADYDPLGRFGGYVACAGTSGLTCEGSPQSVWFPQGYDYAGNLQETDDNICVLCNESDSSGTQVDYTFDSANHLTSLSAVPFVAGVDGASTTLMTAGYNAVGGLTGAQLAIDPGNGTAAMTLSRGYDDRGRLISETDLTSSSANIYNYSLGFQANSNIHTVTDSQMGSWTYGYGYKNQLTSGAATAGTYSGLNLTWSYDSFGDRLTQGVSGTTGASVPSPQTLTYSAGNQIVGYSYDADGNVTDDGTNRYRYDAENRLCAVYNYTGSGAITGYLYGADGSRLEKGTLTSFSCHLTTNGFTRENVYAVGPNGEQVDEADGSYNLIHSNVFLNGRIFATYDSSLNLHYAFTDWLGTRRVQTSAGGTAEGGYLTLPYGDNLTLSGSSGATEHEFTSKERDTESNLDYFGVRYYGSNMGRFMSPDPSGLAFADPGNPQSLNLYTYGLNSPLVFIDPSGMDPDSCLPDNQTCFANGNVCMDGDPCMDGGGGSSGCNSSSCSDPGSAPPTPCNGDTTTYTLCGYYSTPQGPPTPPAPPPQPQLCLDVICSTSVVSVTTVSVTPTQAPNNNTPHTAVAGSVAIPISPGVVADIPFAWIPSTKKVCLGIGGGTGSPGLNVGGVYSSANIENVLSGASVSVAAQSGAVGGQTIHNNSGIAVGNSMGSPGASVTVTYSWCF